MNTTLRPSPAPILRAGMLVFTAILAFAASAMAQEPGKIAYIADEEIWMMEADGSGKEALGLSTSEFRAKGVQLSPDGLWLVFSGNGSGGGTGLYLMKAEPYSDPGNVPSLIGPGASPYKRASWHPDGRYVAYVKDYFDLHLVEALDGNGQPAAAAPAELISTTTTGGNTFDGCAFDPNGRDILVSQTGAPAKLFQVFDDAGVLTAPGTITTITTAPGDVLWPSFSPDGKKIVFQEATNAFSESAIAVLTIRDENGTLTPENATTNPRVLYTPSTLATTSFVASPTWSPDGSKIAFLFSSDITFRFEIVSINASGPESPSNLRVYLAGVNNVNTNYPSFAHPGGGGGSAPITPAPVPLNLISWWPGENAAWDVAGIGEGSMKNSEDFDPYDVGKVGRAFWFDGIDDHVQGSTGLSLNGDFTIEVWVQPEAHSAEAVIVAKGDTADDDVSYSLLLRNGKPWFRSSMGGVEQEIEVGNITYSLPLNQWTHLAFTQNASASRMTFYVDGVLMQQTAAVPPRPNTTGPLTIGAAIDATHPTATPASPFEGLVDELTLYDRALSGTEIQLIVAAGKAGKERHDPARDFSATANPNGVWRFGWVDGAAFEPGFLTDADPGNGGLFAPPAVLDGTTYNYADAPEAHLLFNKSKTDRAVFDGNGGMTTISLAPRQFALEESDDGDYSVVHWTAPKSGTYAISGTFTGVEDLPTDVVVYFYVNDGLEFTAGLNSFLGDGHSFTLETGLNEDDNCTWFVGNGPMFLGDGYTGLVASSVLLEESTPFSKPSLERIDFSAPMMDGKTIKFFARNGDRSANPTMTAKIQYSATPGVPGSWIDLPGGTMDPPGAVGGLTFTRTLSSLPVGTYAFRIATAVAGLGTTFSTPSDTYTILPAGPYYEIELDVTSASDPSGVTTHRGDTIDYTVRFRNSGGQAVPTTDVVKVLARIPGGTAASPTGSSPGYETITSGADTFAIWTLPRALNPVDAELAFTVSNATTDVLFCANHGLEDGALLTVKSTTTLPGGLSEGTVYQAISTSSNSFKLALPGSATPVNVLDSGTGTHTLKRESVYNATNFTVASVEDNLLVGGNIGLKDGFLVTVSKYGVGAALPGGLSAGTVYRVMSVAEDGFQLAVLGSATPVNILDVGVGNFELKRSDLWQTRTLRVKVDDPLTKDEAVVDDLDYGDSLRSFARITNNYAGLGGIKDSAAVETAIINPLHLTAAPPVLDGGGVMRQGALFYVDLTVTNEASYAMINPFLRVHAPEGLVIRSGVFADGINNPPPVVGEDSEGRQILTFEIGALAKGASRVCRVRYRVQYDWSVSTPIEFDLATASENRPTATSYTKVPYKAKVKKRVRVKGRLIWKTVYVNRFRIVPTTYARNGLEREIENPYDLTILAALPGSAKPELQMSVTQHGIGQLPENPKIQMVSNSSALATQDGLTIQHRQNQILYQVTFSNVGDETAEFIRVVVPVPEHTTYAPGSAVVRHPQGEVTPVPAPLLIGSALVFNLPYLEKAKIIGDKKTLEYLVNLNAGTPVDTTITHIGGIISSRDLVELKPYFETLEAQVVIPAKMSYEKGVEYETESAPGGSFSRISRQIHRALFSNNGGSVATGVKIEYTLPPGVDFEDASYVDNSDNPITALPAGRTLPHYNETTRTVTFGIGNVPATSSGWVRLRLTQNGGSVPTSGVDAYETNPTFVGYDSSTGPPVEASESEFALLSLPEGSESPPVRESVPTAYLDPSVPRIAAAIQGSLVEYRGQELVYQVTLANIGSVTSVATVFVPTPNHTEYVRTYVVNEFNLDSPVTTTFLAENQGHPQQQTGGGSIYYKDVENVNPNGGIGYTAVVQPSGAFTIQYTVRVLESHPLNEPINTTVLVLQGGVVRSSSAYSTLVLDPNDSVENRKQRLYWHQMGLQAANTKGTVDKPNTKFIIQSQLMDLGARGVSIGGADVLQLGPVAIIPTGLGNVIALGGANIVAAGGGNIVAAGGGNIVAAGGGNLISVDVPGHGVMPVNSLWADLPAIVAAGGGNIVAGGGLNLIRKSELIGGDGASLIGLDGASLIGLDGASVIATVKANLQGISALVKPGGEVLSISGNAASIAIARAGIVAAGGGNIVAAGGGNIVAAGGGNIITAIGLNTFNPNTIVAAGGGNIVAAGGGNIVAAGGGNIVAAGGGNIIQIGAGVLSHNGNAFQSEAGD